jgi:hypothetical protein
MRSIPTALALFLLAVPAHGGIAYKMHAHTAKGNVVSTVVADGSASRSEIEVTKETEEFLRQYPIVISTDGKTLQHLRPEDQTWYAKRDQGIVGTAAVGTDARVKKPKMTFAEEPSEDVIAGMATRKFVLNASFIVETSLDRETLKLHKARTVLFWVADVPCAPPISQALHGVRFGVPELDDAIDRELGSVKGLIVRQVDSLSERYEGGVPRAFLTTTEIADPQCVDVDSARFTIPKGYRNQEPVIMGIR